MNKLVILAIISSLLTVTNAATCAAAGTDQSTCDGLAGCKWDATGSTCNLDYTLRCEDASLNSSGECGDSDQQGKYCTWDTTPTTPVCKAKACDQVAGGDNAACNANGGVYPECKQGATAADACVARTYASADVATCSALTTQSACQSTYAAVYCQWDSTGNSCGIKYTVSCTDTTAIDSQDKCVNAQGAGNYCKWSTTCVNKSCSEVTVGAACDTGSHLLTTSVCQKNSSGQEGQTGICQAPSGGNNNPATGYAKKCSDQSTQATCQDTNDTQHYCNWNGSTCSDKPCGDVTKAAACAAGSHLVVTAAVKCSAVAGATDNQVGVCENSAAANFAQKCGDLTTAAACKNTKDTQYYCSWGGAAGNEQCRDLPCGDVKKAAACAAGTHLVATAAVKCSAVSGATDNQVGVCENSATANFAQKCGDQTTAPACKNTKDTLHYCTWGGNAGSEACTDKACNAVTKQAACASGSHLYATASNKCKQDTTVTDGNTGVCVPPNFALKCSEQNSSEKCQGAIDTAFYCSWTDGSPGTCADKACNAVTNEAACASGSHLYANAATKCQKNPSGTPNTAGICEDQPAGGPTDFTKKCSDQNTEANCQRDVDTKAYCSWDASKADGSKCFDKACKDVTNATACSANNHLVATATNKCEKVTGATAGQAGVCKPASAANFSKLCPSQTTQGECQDKDDTQLYCSWNTDKCEAKACTSLTGTTSFIASLCSEVGARAADCQIDSSDNTKCANGVGNGGNAITDSALQAIDTTSDAGKAAGVTTLLGSDVSGVTGASAAETSTKLKDFSAKLEAVADVVTEANAENVLKLTANVLTTALAKATDADKKEIAKSVRSASKKIALGLAKSVTVDKTVKTAVQIIQILLQTYTRRRVLATRESPTSASGDRQSLNGVTVYVSFDDATFQPTRVALTIANKDTYQIATSNSPVAEVTFYSGTGETTAAMTTGVAANVHFVGAEGVAADTHQLNRVKDDLTVEKAADITCTSATPPVCSGAITANGAYYITTKPADGGNNGGNNGGNTDGNTDGDGDGDGDDDSNGMIMTPLFVLASLVLAMFI